MDAARECCVGKEWGKFGIFLSHKKKKNEIVTFAETWIDLETVLWSERESQKRKNIGMSIWGI